MQHVITYDISDDARRGRLANVLLDFGSRIEESVFVANLDGPLAARMLERVRQTVDPDRDQVHVFRLCSACEAKTIAIGDARVLVDPQFYIV